MAPLYAHPHILKVKSPVKIQHYDNPTEPPRGTVTHSTDWVRTCDVPIRWTFPR